MKKNFTRLLSVLLLVCILVSCGAKPGKTEQTTETQQTTEALTSTTETTETNIPAETELSDDIPKLDFKQQEFVILVSTSSSQHYITTVHEMSGDVLQDAMYKRTLEIEEKYNIKFTEDYVASGASEARELINRSVASGDAAYDLAMLLDRYAFTMSAKDNFICMEDLEYVHLDKPYWFSDINETINFTGKTYLTYGSVNISVYDLTHALCFNKQMLESLSLENPYELVLDGKWTLEKMQQMGQAAISDLDGNGTFDNSDVYAILGSANALPASFIAGAKQKTIVKTEDGGVQIELLTNPQIEEIFTKVTEMCWGTGFWNKVSGDARFTNTHFQEGKSLFADKTFHGMIALRDMVADFGIVPYPKYNEDQDGYGSLLEAGTRTVVIPCTAKDPAMSGAVLETLNFLSYRDVLPAYYEVVMKTKVSRDDVAAQMLDITMESVFYDLGMTVFNDMVKDGIFKSLFAANNLNYVSRVKGQIKPIEAAVKKASGTP